MIPQETIERVREATDIARIIGEYIRLKKRGRNYEAVCPFHIEKTPSFKVNTDRQIYHCFGCGKGGNVFRFLMEHEKMSFVEAVKHLAAKAGVVIRDEVSDVRREQMQRLNYAHEVAVDYYHRLLFESRYHKVLQGYLRDRRQISDDSIEQFKLGLAGERWDGLVTHATGKGLKPEELVKAGLASYSEKKGNYFDRFRQRLMIPIFNLSNRPIAFGGRTLKKGEPAKYVNSPETPLYSKSGVLYGLNFARETIRDTGTVIVVEGYFDFISLWQVGVHNVVASSGTAFTQQQAQLLARFAGEVYLFFDADSAGQQAALRSVDALYDAGIEVKVMIPPEGEDPDSVARQFGGERIEQLRHEALGYIPYRVKDVRIDDTGIVAREKLVKELGALGEKISDPTRRSIFFQEAAQALRIDMSVLTSARQAVAPRPVEPERSTRYSQTEFELLSLLLSYPGAVDPIFEQISPDDFDSRQLSRLYAAMITQYETDGALSANRLVEHFQDDQSVSLLTELAAVEWDQEKVDHEIKERVQDFVKKRQKDIRSQLKRELGEAEAEGNQKRAEEIVERLKQLGL
ncbi:MAG TPA: DNA primase [Acidobacteriota bacterium]|nr:DNA primase [Acidobacteriota bacterium]